MLRLRSIFSFLLVAMIIPFQGAIPGPVTGLAIPSGIATGNYVNLYIDEITILGDIGDIAGEGEFRLIVLASDTNGKSSGMFCPGDKPLKVRKGDTVKTPCLFSMGFPEDQAADGVYLTVMAVDEDKSSLPADLSYDAASIGLSKALGSVVKTGGKKLGISALTKSVPVMFVASVLYSVLSGKLKEWIQRADIIGSQGIYLSRRDNWSAGKTNIVKSADGGIQIVYSIVRTSSAPANPRAPVLGSPSPSTSGSSQTSTEKYWCDDLQRVKLKVGDRAKVVWMKVNLRTAPIVPQEFYENSISKVDQNTPLTVIGGPACSHEGTWWQVRLQNGQTGWMREYISTGYLIGK
jgi:hypothetical protein